MSRRWLVAVSVVAHAVVGVSLYVSGVWHIERMEAGRRPLDITVPLAPPAPAGELAGAVRPEITPKVPKPQIVKEPTQPEDRKPEDLTPAGDGSKTPGPLAGEGDPTAIGTCIENCADTSSAEPVCGDRSVDVREQCDDGNTTSGDGCSSTCQTEVKRPPDPLLVRPTVLQGLRISGETQVHPSTATQNLMLRDDRRQVRSVVKLCLSTSGTVVSASTLLSTSYAAYDATILSAVRSWRYRPYTVNGTPVPACSTVTFVYTIR